MNGAYGSLSEHLGRYASPTYPTITHPGIFNLNSTVLQVYYRTARFSSVWQDTLSVLVARGRARVSVSASAADWPKRIRDMQYVDHDDFAVAH